MTDQNWTGDQGTGGSPDPYGAPQPGGWQQPAPPAGPPGQGHGSSPGYGAPPAYGQQLPYGQQPAYGQPPVYGQQPAYGQPPAYNGYPPPQQRTNGMAVASMILGILWIYWIGSILALVFGYIARNQIRERGESGGGMATAGIVLGWIGVGFIALALIVGIAANA
jgi:Domain of unknown function (DUF4190)